MAFIDLILNCAGLLLWLKWRDKGFEAFATKRSLVVTLKTTNPRPKRAWFLMGLFLLLLIRPLFYSPLGSAMNWTAQLWFGIIPLAFRSDYFLRMLCFSFLSFAKALGFFYLCLLLLSIVNRRASDPLQTLVRDQLGFLDNVPVVVKLFLPWLTMFVVWCSINKPLVALGILPKAESWRLLLEQSAVASFSVYFAWQYLVVAILGIHLLSSYIYFGAGPAVVFIETTAMRMLKGLSWLPLRAGKIDFAPAIAIALVIVAGIYGPLGLFWIYQRLPF